jgi:hypothetical protein
MGQVRAHCAPDSQSAMHFVRGLPTALGPILVITVRVTDEEADVTGSVEELQEIRAFIQRLVGSSELSLSIRADDAANPSPYTHSLREFRVLRGGDRTRVSVQDHETLVISGPDENLIKFSSWFDFTSDAKDGSHSHFEPLPDDCYVAADSLPLVVSVSSAGPTSASTRRAKTHARDA